jgi:dethiobiotin synthetase
MKNQLMGSPVFIAGIGTDIGKTIVATILVEAFEADYWKPIQAGNLDSSDSMLVCSLLSNETSVVHPEAYKLKEPCSPHEAARLDGVQIELAGMQLPETNNMLCIEGAGGLLVPLNNKDLLIDLIQKMNVPVVLVSSNYLGSINHTLLSVEALKTRNIPCLGIVFNGNSNSATESILLEKSGMKCLARIPHLETIDKETIKAIAATIDISLFVP